MGPKVKTVSASVKATDTGGFKGYASRFLNIDRDGDIIAPGAFAKSLPGFIEDGGLVLVNHENRSDAVIGTLVDAIEDRYGLLVSVQFSATKSAQDVRQLLIEKALRKMSIQFYGKSQKYTESQVKALWDTYGHKPTAAQMKLAARGAKVITEVTDILEVSVVPIPANPDANILSVKSADDIETPVAVAPPIDWVPLFTRAELADRLLGR